MMFFLLPTELGLSAKQVQTRPLIEQWAMVSNAVHSNQAAAPTEKSLSLEAGYKEALGYYRLVRRHQLDLEVSADTLAKVELAYQPTFSSISDFHVNPLTALSDTSSYDFSNDLYRVGFQAQYTIFDSGLRQAQVKYERLSQLKTANGVDLTDQQLKLAVLRAYFTLLRAQQTKNLGAIYTQAAQGLYDQVKGRMDNGLAAEPELKFAEAELTRSKADEIEHDLAVLQSSRELALLIGRDYSNSSVAAQDIVATSENPTLPDDLINKYVDSSYTVQSAVIGVAQAQQTLREIRAKYGPQVSTVGQVGYGSFLEFPSGHYASRPYIFLGISLSIPLFVGPARKLDEKIGKDTVELRELDVQEAKRTAAYQALSTQGIFHAAEAEVPSFKASISSAETAVDLARQRYANGLGTPLEIIQGMRQLYTATNGLNTAISQELEALEQAKVITVPPHTDANTSK